MILAAEMSKMKITNISALVTYSCIVGRLEIVALECLDDLIIRSFAYWRYVVLVVH